MEHSIKQLRTSHLDVLLTSVGCSAEAVVIAWLLHHPARQAPVLGSQRVQVDSKALAALKQPMDAESWERVWSAGAGRAVD